MRRRPQEVRRSAASKAEVEGDARKHANRVKRLQGEVEMIRSEYEVVSEEVAGLRVAEVGRRHKGCVSTCGVVGWSLFSRSEGVLGRLLYGLHFVEFDFELAGRECSWLELPYDHIIF